MVLLAGLAALTLTAGCRDSATTAPAGYEPAFRSAYPGRACAALAVETGPASKLCEANAARHAACAVFWSHEPTSTMAIVEGTLTGLICERHGLCREGAAAVVAAAMLEQGTKTWIPPAGVVSVAGREVDVERSLTRTCTDEGQRGAAAAAALRDRDEALKDWTPAIQQALTGTQEMATDVFRLTLRSRWRGSRDGASIEVGQDVEGFDTRRVDSTLLLTAAGNGANAFLSCEPGGAGVVAMTVPDEVAAPAGLPPGASAPLVEIAFRIASRTEVGAWCENHMPGASYAIRKRALGLEAEVVAVRARDPDGTVLIDWSSL